MIGLKQSREVGSVRFESVCVGVRFLSFEPLQLKCSHNFFLFYNFFTFCRYRCFSSSWRCFDVNWHLDGLYPILAALIHSYVKIKFCTWCLQVAPSIWEFVVYLINVLCSFEQSELGHKAGADLEGGVRPLKFAKHMLYNVN